QFCSPATWYIRIQPLPIVPKLTVIQTHYFIPTPFVLLPDCKNFPMDEISYFQLTGNLHG
ncbi:hypothetical protein, partial [Vibrio parahaemolyticus]|uniref:hypothetical protein n=1 Tax=Vibrio parahaemolyticus TaxID=670 RepID=UPI001E43802E